MPLHRTVKMMATVVVEDCPREETERSQAMGLFDWLT